MYKVSVPLVRFDENYEDNIREAKKLGAERLFLCPCRATAPKNKRKAHIEAIRKSREIYEAAGFEVGVWISTMGHGGDLVGLSADADDGYTHITGVRGVTTEDSYCPLDPNFSTVVCSYLKEIAATGVKMIMLDDDYRFSHRSDCGCTCRYHMEEYEKRLGEKISREEVFEKVFCGGYNRYRQIYYDMLGDTLRNFAAQMRAAIDEINPEVRFGFCAVTSSWDCDGTDAIELSKIMAGGTKPFLRLIAAPYWANNGGADKHVQYVAELERMQAKWCENEGIEIFSEGDTYPRPRYVTPAAMLENFDTILRADGNFDGILKYGIDYISSPCYETGYADHAVRNRELYEKIQKFFGDKKAVGINVTCEMKKLLHTDFAEPEQQIGGACDSAFYQSEQILLTNCSVLSTYDDAPVTVAFGENGKYIRNSGNGFIIDAVAAENLNALGIDTGIESINKNEKLNIVSEYFCVENEFVSTDASCGAILIKPKSGVKVLSEFEIAGKNGKKTHVPSCLKYENENGQRFLIYAYDFDGVRRNTYFMRNYMRQEQLIREYEWLAQEKLPAVCRNHPDLYIMAKKKDGSMAVGLWNIFPDEIFKPVVELDKEYKTIKFINGSGNLAGYRVIFDSDISAYGFAGFEVSE